jgi:hypothetical protein
VINIYKLLLLASFVVFSIESFAQNSKRTLIFDFNSYNFSAPKTIHSYTGKFNGDLYHGDHALSLNTTSVGIQFKNLSLNILHRSDYIQSYTNDTATFYHQYKNSITSSNNHEYKLEMATSQFEATGLKIDYWHHASSQFSFNIAATYFSGSDFNNGRLFGQGQWQNSQQFTINAPAVIHSAHNDLLAFPKANASGNGFSIDFRAKWHINPQWQFDYSSNDAVSKIKWRDALLTNIDHWQLYRINSDGKLDTNPMVIWKKTYYEQKLPKTQIGYLSYTNTKNIEYYSKIISTEYFSHHQFGLKKTLADNQSIFLSLHRDLSAIEIGLNKPNSYVSLTADVFSSKIGRALNIEFGFSRPF